MTILCITGAGKEPHFFPCPWFCLIRLRHASVHTDFFLSITSTGINFICSTRTLFVLPELSLSNFIWWTWTFYVRHFTTWHCFIPTRPCPATTSFDSLYDSNYIGVCTVLEELSTFNLNLNVLSGSLMPNLSLKCTSRTLKCPTYFKCSTRTLIVRHEH